MFQPPRTPSIDRRRLLAGAVGLSSLRAVHDSTAQTVAPTATTIPTRIQTPDLAFADPLRQLRDVWAESTGTSDVILSIVPAEPASDSLLADARSGARRFSGAIVPNWLIPDLVRDAFIAPAPAPSQPLPASIARLRSFDGQWIATDLDHDCDLLFFRRDSLGRAGLGPAETWHGLLDQCTSLSGRETGSIALPMTHSQQGIEHFISMAAAFALGGDPSAPFWFDAETMDPAIASGAHQQALELWQALGATAPEAVQSGGTGDLWQAFLNGSVTYLIAPASFVPFALDQGFDPDLLGIAQLPGVRRDDGTVTRCGNVTGASWGGVVMSSAGQQPSAEVVALLESFATTDSQMQLWSNQASGVVPAPVADSDVDSIASRLTEAGWNTAIATSWLQALQVTFTNPAQLAPLRIAETQRYLQALEIRIVAFLSGDTPTASDALELAAQDWREINDAIDIDVQRTLFAQSMMPPPAG